MRKKLLLPIIIFVGALTSCNLDTDENSATSTQSYYGIVDSIKYNNEGDSIYGTYIKYALNYDSVMYFSFSKSATINYSSISAATTICDTLAKTEIISRAKKVTLAEVKKAMYKLYAADSLSQYSSYSEIPLNSFKVYYSLKSTSYTSYGQPSSIYNDSIDVR